MTSKFKQAKVLPMALVTAAMLLLQPIAYAQSSPKSGGELKQTGKTESPSMPEGMDMKGMDMKGMDMKAMMKDCHEKMSSMKMTGNSDIDFAMMMRMHHQGAIEMAEAEMRDGKDPKIRKMATTIIAAQKKEIVQLDAFLSKNGYSVDKTNNK